MTEGEKRFIEKFNEMLAAAKEMEKEGKYTTSFTTGLRSLDIYITDRDLLDLEIQKTFLKNGFNIEKRA